LAAAAIAPSNKGFPELEEKTMWDYFMGLMILKQKKKSGNSSISMNI